jgi:hypothetical protein
VSEAIDLVGQYRYAGVDLLINSDYRSGPPSQPPLTAGKARHLAGHPAKNGVQLTDAPRYALPMM